jgi:hypothetical protein
MCDQWLLLERAKLYADRNGTEIIRTVELGHGMDGSVWASKRDSAIKAIRMSKNYADELEAYRRLQAANIHELCGFAVPRLIGSDAELRVIEMSIVQKPYALDFGKVYFDGAQRQAFEDRELRRERSAARSRYGTEWSRVAALLHVLESSFGIYYVDPRPTNIDCGEFAKDDPDWDKEPPLDYSEYEN